VLHETVHPVGDDRLEQRLLGREVPVDRARADAGSAGDLVDRDRQPLRGERLVGHIEHTGTVASGVGTQLPRFLLHMRKITRSLVDKRGVRSV
jgi:hypothetical protein